MELIKRDLYLRQIEPFMDKPIVKVISGIRRCGKSVILKLLCKELQSRGVEEGRIVYLNFESFELREITGSNELYNYVKERLPANGGKVYILLDEVQEVKDWEQAVNSFIVDWGADVYVTGSNSKMLSSELATYLTGRYVSFHIQPLSYGEYLQFRSLAPEDGGSAEKAFRHYLRLGGFPSVHLAHFEEEDAYRMVRDIYASIILRDTIQRYGIRNVDLFERVVGFVFDNIGNRLNAKNVADYFKSQHRRLDVNTVYDYLNNLQSTFIIQRVPRYDIAGREILKTNEKYFVSDLSLIFSLMGYRERMIGGALENIVYWELRSRGFNVYIGKQGSMEVDFVAVRGQDRLYVQVTYKMPSEDTVQREYTPLECISDNYPKYVLSMEQHWDSNRNGILHRFIPDFLLDKSWG